MSDLIPYYCKCDHSRGYHKDPNQANIFSKKRTGGCTYDNCDCIKYKSIPENRPSVWKKPLNEWLTLIPLFALNTLVLFYLIVPGFGLDIEINPWSLELVGLVLLYKGIQFVLIIAHIHLTRNMFGQRECRVMKGVKDV